VRFRTARFSCFIVVCAFLFGTSASARDDQGLSRKEQRVIDYLVKDWAEDFGVTSVDIAMKEVGVSQSDKTRFRIGSYIKTHPELHQVVRRWGWVTIVLTPNEKLIARALINAERDGQPAPTIRDLAKSVSISESKVRRGLVMLERFEIVTKDKDTKGVYRVVQRYIKWQPRLDFVFHTLTLERGRQFNVN
jgi:hypothetical protein